MVGWTHRNTESNQRRARWWASLSEEEKKVALAEQAKDDRIAILLLTVLALVALIASILFALRRP
jgi:hypothetical protein